MVFVRCRDGGAKILRHGREIRRQRCGVLPCPWGRTPQTPVLNFVRKDRPLLAKYQRSCTHTRSTCTIGWRNGAVGNERRLVSLNRNRLTQLAFVHDLATKSCRMHWFQIVQYEQHDNDLTCHTIQWTTSAESTPEKVTVFRQQCLQYFRLRCIWPCWVPHRLLPLYLNTGNVIIRVV